MYYSHTYRCPSIAPEGSGYPTDPSPRKPHSSPAKVATLAAEVLMGLAVIFMAIYVGHSNGLKAWELAAMGIILTGTVGTVMGVTARCIYNSN